MHRIIDALFNRLGSRTRVNETSQISERYSVQMKAAMKQKRLAMLDQMYLDVRYHAQTILKGFAKVRKSAQFEIFALLSRKLPNEQNGVKFT